MFRCMICGKELGWQSDFNLDEINPEEAKCDSGVVGIYTCNNCEVDYEITTYEKQEHISVKFYEVEE